jgi:hypothetical protein
MSSSLSMSWMIPTAMSNAVLVAVLGTCCSSRPARRSPGASGLFGTDTPAVLVDGNRQDELNLHNVDASVRRR